MLLDMVSSLVTSRSDEITKLCRLRRVQTLSVFGSATTGEFQQSRSDLDFLVEFERMSPGDHANAYFGLLNDLRSLFDREVDLVELEGVRNEYVRASIEKSRVPVYAAA
jgi:predicted nucleotidyltransferase